MKNNIINIITPLRIENAQSASSSSLITAPEGGVLNERRCKTFTNLANIQYQELSSDLHWTTVPNNPNTPLPPIPPAPPLRARKPSASRSSFSYAAAILSDGVIYYQPFWHPPGDKWIVC